MTRVTDLYWLALALVATALILLVHVRCDVEGWRSVGMIWILILMWSAYPTVLWWRWRSRPTDGEPVCTCQAPRADCCTCGLDEERSD